MIKKIRCLWCGKIKASYLTLGDRGNPICKECYAKDELQGAIAEDIKYNWQQRQKRLGRKYLADLNDWIKSWQ